MEVHAHSRIPRGREKKWTHYFWEFLMLFLAVFCGFLAEYQLEHKIERDREKVYIKNLYADLASDTLIYRAYQNSGIKFANDIDSLIRFLKSPGRDNNLDKIYFLARTITIHSNIVYPNQRTFIQMKNSGSLRLISKQKVAENVSSYYLLQDEIHSQNDFILGMISDYWDEAGNLFDAETLYRIRKENKLPGNKDLALMTNDPVRINKFLVNVQYFYGSRMKQSEAIIGMLEKANELIQRIKKEYHFK